MIRWRRFLSLFLVLSLVVAVLPVATHAGMQTASGPTQTVNGDDHARHPAGMHESDASGAAMDTSCLAGTCAPCCGHCATTLAAASGLFLSPHPVWSPFVLTLSLNRPAAAQYRPPQA